MTAITMTTQAVTVNREVAAAGLFIRTRSKSASSTERNRPHQPGYQSICQFSGHLNVKLAKVRSDQPKSLIGEVDKHSPSEFGRSVKNKGGGATQPDIAESIGRLLKGHFQLIAALHLNSDGRLEMVDTGADHGSR